MSEYLKQIARLIPVVEIQDVRLVEASVKTRIRSSREVGEADFLISTTATVKERRKDGTFFVIAVINAQVVPSESTDPAVSVRAGFELSYRLPGKFTASQRELNAFARINGVFNAWPYWREFIQNVFARMNLPPVALPIFRLTDAVKRSRKYESRRQLAAGEREDGDTQKKKTGKEIVGPL